MGPSPLRDIYVVLAMVVLANGPLFFIARKFLDRPGTWEGPILRPALVVAILGGVLAVVLDSARQDDRRLFRPAPLAFGAAIGLGVWAAISTFWSVAPGITLWRGLLYMALPFVAWVVADLDDQRLMRGLRLAFGSMLAASLAVVALWPSAGLDRNDDWRGVFTGRNSLAPVCAIVTILAVANYRSGRRLAGTLGVGFGIVGLLGSGSRTAWFALVVALGAATILAVGRSAYSRRPTAEVKVVALGSLVVSAMVGIGLVGRFWDEPTFAQRRVIWDLVGDSIADHRWRGVGFEAFWYVPDLIGRHDLLARGSAHGSVPELLLGLGVVGLIPWLVVVGLAAARTIRDCWRQPSTPTWTWTALTVFLIAENLTESFVSWFSYNWVLLIAFALRAGGVRRSERPGKTIRSSESATL